MKWSDSGGLLALGALWGSSYLFMRLGAGEFGAACFAGLRAALAAACLLPLLAWRRGFGALRAHWRPIALLGIANAALPYLLFGYAAQTLDAGMSAIFSAATPLYAAVIASLWLRDRLGPSRIAGLALGFAGVVWLAWSGTAFHGGGGRASLACVAATLLHGFSANFARRHLHGVPPLAVAAGGQLAAALLLAAPALCHRPRIAPGAHAWADLLALTLACTAVAYVLLFHLIARLGAARASTVSFLIPAFGVLWGALFLKEPFTPAMALGCAIVMAGTAMTTAAGGYPRPGSAGFAGRWRRSRQPGTTA